MKKYYKLIALFISISTFSQDYGSGIIEFNADQDLPINITAISLFDNGEHVYHLSGMTNKPISFDSWLISGSLSVDEFDLEKNMVILKNPNGSLNVSISSNTIQNIDVKIFDIDGKFMGDAKEMPNLNGRVYFYHSMRNLSQGLYFIKVEEDNNITTLKFLKNGDETIPQSFLNKISNTLTNNNQSFRRNNGSNNYLLTWDNGYGIVENSREFEILEGTNNEILTGVYTLEKPYFNITGQIINALDGVSEFRANYFTLKSSEILDGNFSLSHINSYIENYPTEIEIAFDENNNVIDVTGEIRIQHGTYQTLTIPVSLTSDNPGENNIDLGNIEVTPVDFGNDSESGDVAVSGHSDGSPTTMISITLTNTHFPENTYTIHTNDESHAIFWDIYIPDSHNPSVFEIKIADDREVATFSETIVYRNLYQDTDGEINGTKSINLNPLPPPPDYQNITMVVRDFETLELLPNAIVDMYETKVVNTISGGGFPYWYTFPYSSDKILESAVSDDEGKVYFENVEKGSAVYFKVSKDVYFKKINRGYRLPEKGTYQETDTVLNITALKHFNYEDNTPVTADTLMRYNSSGANGVNSEFVLGHMKVYFDPNDDNREATVQHLNEYAELLGIPGGFEVIDTPFDNSPPAGSINNYNPYPLNRNVLEGQVGYSLYDGSSMTNTGNVYMNDCNYNFHGVIYGGPGFHVMDHEVGHALGFNHTGGNWSTMYAVGAITGLQASESKYDKAIMPVWIRFGKLHLDTFDSEGRFIDYSVSRIIEEYDPIYENQDDDDDGVINKYDICEDTLESESVDEYGCAAYQKDDDEDGITNDLDECPNTEDDAEVNSAGCAINQLDDDNDGVMNDADICPDTPSGDLVDGNGCS